MGTNYSTAFGPYPLVGQEPGTLSVFSEPHLSCPHEMLLVLPSRVFEQKDEATIMFIDGAHSIPYAKVTQ